MPRSLILNVLVFELMNPRTYQATHWRVCNVMYLVRKKETATIDGTWTDESRISGCRTLHQTHIN